MAKTKIVIIQLKEIIYTAIFVGLAILLILLLVFMFLPKKDKAAPTMAEDKKYTAGVYTSQVKLNNSALNIEVVVDEDHINSVRMVNLDDSVATMYPLMEPSLEHIAKQLYNNVDVNDVKLLEESKYTQNMLLNTIKTTLDKALIKQEVQ